MRFSSLFTLLLATCSIALPNRNIRSCGNTFSDEDRVLSEAPWAEEPEHLEGTEHTLIEEVPSLGGNRFTNINMYWHVIQKSENKSEGHVTAREMAAQVKVLNTAFRVANIQFVLKDKDYTTNADWFDHFGKNTSQNVDVKELLRKGDRATLNVYSTGFVYTKEGARSLGYTTFPWHFKTKARGILRPKDDGAVFLWSTIPGGSTPEYNLGHTLTHEVGHWLGLIHTFESGCDYSTVSPGGHESGPKCKNSCPYQKDIKPITNFMDYDVDSCLGSFNPSQIRQIRKQLQRYRGIKVPSRFDQDRLGVEEAQIQFDLAQ